MINDYIYRNRNLDTAAEHSQLNTINNSLTILKDFTIKMKRIRQYSAEKNTVIMHGYNKYCKYIRVRCKKECLIKYNRSQEMGGNMPGGRFSFISFNPESLFIGIGKLLRSTVLFIDIK